MISNEILKEFGKNLKAERNRANLSQEELAEKAGISFGQIIGNIERVEVNTTLLHIAMILKALDIKFEMLLDINKFK